MREGKDQLTPSRADPRMIRRILDLTLKGKVVQSPSECDFIGRVFLRAGGSWKSVYLGSSEDISLLKKIARLAYKHGDLTRVEPWT